MFKNTKLVLLEMWAESTICKDPAPLPWDGKGLSDLAKALYQDVKDIFGTTQD